MKKTSNKWMLVLSIMMMCMLTKPVMAYGNTMVPDTIRVGLRSAYVNKSSIEIKNTELEVGYESNNQFIPQATLISNTGFVVRPNQKQYYDTKEQYYTYNQAAFSVLAYKEEGIAAVVAYKWPGIWTIYLEGNREDMELVRATGFEIIVQDGQGMDLLLCDKTGAEPAFAGINKNQPFNLTELSKGTYRGWFEFKRQVNTVTAINVVDHQDYLYGVIPSEMPASWHMEALKAQAVVARSMSIYQSKKYLKDGYNVCDTVYTQVYKGFSGESARTNQAVDETRGMVATYKGNIAETVFFSTSGGHTEDPQYVWGNPIPYLKARPDPYEIEPEGKPWTRTITLAEIDRSLKSQGIQIGTAQGLKINGYTPAGRVMELEIIGSLGSHKITKENIRTFFASTNEGSLRSRMFTIENSTIGNNASLTALKSLEELKVYRGDTARYVVGGDGLVVQLGESVVVEGKNGQTTYGESNKQGGHVAYGDIVLSGKGYGHGVGMSQSGAKGMADAGYTYDQIIEYYYQGVRVER